MRKLRSRTFHVAPVRKRRKIRRKMSAPPLLLGHRGTRALRAAPENSFAAFDAALAQGCDGFEFDVRATADGALVTVHDPKYRGVTVAKAKQSRLAKLPQLAEVLQSYGARGFLDIELKVEGMGAAVLQLLRDHQPIRGYVVSSFLPSVVLELRARRSGIPLGIICEKASQLRRGLELPVDYMILAESLVAGRGGREGPRGGKTPVGLDGQQARGHAPPCRLGGRRNHFR